MAHVTELPRPYGTLLCMKPFFSPDTTVQAQGSFAGVQYTGAGLGGYFFDSRTGDMWTYGKGQGREDRQEWQFLGKVTKLGGPVAR